MQFTPSPRPESLTLGDLLDRMAQKQPHRPAVIHFADVITYAELRTASHAAARSLLALGVGRGDRVGVLLGNQPEWITLCLGSAYIGATFVPLNTWYKDTEIEWTLAHCGLSVLVCASRFLNQNFADMVSRILPELATSEPGNLCAERFPNLRAVVFLGDRVAGALAWNEFIGGGAQTAANSLQSAMDAVTGSDHAFILYTSGSTAEPKGVLLNHGSVVQNGFDMGERRFIISDDRIWLGSPLFYGLGATNAMPVAFTHGASLVIQGAFDPGIAIETIATHQATAYYGTGNMTRAILDHPDYSTRKVGSLKKGNAGTMTEFKRMTLVEMGISLASPAYGLTESYGNATVGMADDPLEAKLRTNGRPLPGTELLIVDPQTSVSLPQGQTGLILLRGHTTPGYFGNPEETSRALRPDGFFDTGDLGSLDGEGRLIFHSRLKDVIKSGGINISPIEVEQLLMRHPHVRDAHVVAIPHPKLGEMIVAFVDASQTVPEQEVKDFVKERAASFKVPHHVVFRSEEQLPRLASGKVAKYRLVQEATREFTGEGT